MPRLALLCAFMSLAACSAANTTKPHVMFILLDDLGHAELGYHRTTKTKEVQTPSIDALLNDGVNLNRHYVHKFCSPTRCAIQSGRAPIHVNVINIAPEVSNASDPVSGYAGIAPNMTGIAAVMKTAGYKTHMVGKWYVDARALLYIFGNY
jgi:arylsulfatase I/J